MSYCRWSSDNFRCDVYVYESCHGGWMTHVVGNRLVRQPPKLPDISRCSTRRWLRANNRRTRWFDNDPKRVDIGLPHDCATFNDSTPGECADRLEYLRGLGYHVPQYAIDALREEQEEATP